MIPSQLLKGTLEGCILAVLSQKPTYGYEITEQARIIRLRRDRRGYDLPAAVAAGEKRTGAGGISRLEVGPKRKYYALTEKGRAELQEFLLSYREPDHCRRQASDRYRRRSK